jgi:CDP-glycerol glycerophosphotransferase
MTKYVISSCNRFSCIYVKEWDIPVNKFLPFGMPRNDIFFSDNRLQREKVIDYFGIKKTVKIVLYAPTFRGDHLHLEKVNYNFDTNKILQILQIKFENDFVLLFRPHHNYGNNCDISNIISAYDYPDMQELLFAADILITDYSSSMWDFSLMYKPCFIFAPDMEKYKTTRGFYTPIEEWPFPVAKTDEEFVDNIQNFNIEAYIQNVKQHHLNLGSYETGTATKQFCEFLFD